MIVSQKGIEVDPAKVQAIRDMPTSKTEKQSLKLLRKDQLYSSLHSTIESNVRSLVQALEEGYKDRMGK